MTEYSINVAAVQYATDLDNRTANRERGIRLMDDAAHSADLVLLPENSFTKSYFEKDLSSVQERIPGSEEVFVSEIASVRGAYICYSEIESEGDRFFSTSILVSPAGERVGKQRKLHPSPAELGMGISPGEGLKVFQTGLGRICILPGLDVLNQDCIRSLEEQRAEILLIPCLLRAKDQGRPVLPKWEAALEIVSRRTSCIMLWANKTGRENGSVLLGNSMIIEPDRIVSIGSVDQEEVVRARLMLEDWSVVRGRAA